MGKYKLEEFLKKAESHLKEIGNKVKGAAKDLQQEAFYGAMISRIKLEEMGLKNKQKQLFTKIGKIISTMVKKLPAQIHIKEKSKLARLFEENKKIEKEIKQKQTKTNLIRRELAKIKKAKEK